MCEPAGGAETCVFLSLVTRWRLEAAAGRSSIFFFSNALFLLRVATTLAVSILNKAKAPADPAVFFLGGGTGQQGPPKHRKCDPLFGNHWSIKRCDF